MDEQMDGHLLLPWIASGQKIANIYINQLPIKVKLTRNQNELPNLSVKFSTDNYSAFVTTFNIII